MPSVNKTTNLGLNQWAGNEYPKRLDFVEDNAAIDAAVGKLSSLVTTDKTNLVAAVNEVKEQNNTLVANKADLIDGKVPAGQLPEMNYMSPESDGKDVTVTFTEALAKANISTGEKLSVLFGKIKKYFTDLKTVAFTGSYTDLSNKPTSLPADGGNAATATKLQTARQINGVAFDGTANITVADGTKAPTSHASTGTSYGLGTTANYGHVKTVNALTQASHVDGLALSAYQGKVLDDKITLNNPTPIHVTGIIPQNALVTEVFNFDATKGYKLLFAADSAFGMFFIDGLNGIVSGLFNRGRDYTYEKRIVLTNSYEIITYSGSTGSAPTYMRKIGNVISIAISGSGYADEAYQYDLM